MKWMTLLLVLAGCDPTVSIGDPDAGMDASSLGGGAGGGTAGGGMGGGSGGGGGGDPVCNRWGSASATLLAGRSSCVGTNNTITSDPDALNTCLSGIQMCSTADRTQLDTYLSCLEQAPRCTAGNEDAAVNGFMNCVSTAFATLSSTCRSALVRARPAGKRVFITRQRFNGNLGGLAGGDTKCAAAATAAGLNGTWKAWLSTTTVNAIDRLVDVGAWVDTQGATAFASKSALTTGPANSLWYDEAGGFLSSDNIWTATNSSGTYQWGVVMAPPCDEWTSASMQSGARVGQVGRTGPEWTSYSGTTCDQTAHLLCFEQ
ncbi:MAG: hypothetical protein Q8K32_27835 [Archangium sp.]|nr:hypothetical protein [Archangium sp.]